jgi:hypothetical protein
MAPLEHQQKQAEFHSQMEKLTNATAFTTLMRLKSDKEWQQAESNRALGYNKQSDRKTRQDRLDRERQEELDARKRQD